MVLLPALNLLRFCNELFCFRLETVKDDLQHDLTRMTDKADGSVVLAQLQVAFLWECDKLGLSPCGRPFSCLPSLVAD